MKLKKNIFFIYFPSYVTIQIIGSFLPNIIFILVYGLVYSSPKRLILHEINFFTSRGKYCFKLRTNEGKKKQNQNL